jgi:phage tail-like protein
MTDLEDPALSLFFNVTVDQYDLGIFTGCSGLGCEVKVEEREEGGNQMFVHQLPGRMTFSNIVLTRPVDGGTQYVARWITDMATNPHRSTGSITVMTLEGARIASWGLLDVIPVKWKGPQMASDGGAALATETLELAHHGFVDPGQPG